MYNRISLPATKNLCYFKIGPDVSLILPQINLISITHIERDIFFGSENILTFKYFLYFIWLVNVEFPLSNYIIFSCKWLANFLTNIGECRLLASQALCSSYLRT